MAFTKITDTDLAGRGVIGQADTPGLTAQEMQQKVEEVARAVIIPRHNGLIDELAAQTGAAQVGAAAPEGVAPDPAPGAGQAASVQGVLGGLRNMAAAHTARADNPHGVTAQQAGAYTKAETDAAISEKVVAIGAGDMAKAVYDPADRRLPLLPATGDGSAVTVAFTAAGHTEAPATGETLAVLTGKMVQQLGALAQGLAQRYTAAESDARYATAAQGAAADAAVPATRKVAGKALSADVTLEKGDVGLSKVANNTISMSLSGTTLNISFS